MPGQSLKVGRVLVLAAVLAMPAARAGSAPAAVAPARYQGSVTYYGRPATEGMLVSAHLGDRVLATAAVVVSGGVATYRLTVPGDDPATEPKEGPVEGEPVRFRVHGVGADEVELFNAGEDRRLDLHVTRIEICLGAYEDWDRDQAHDPAEPWLAGVVINVLRYFVERSYTTTGALEPSCSTHEPGDVVVRAVDWPSGFDPPTGQGQPSVTIEQTEGVFQVIFPFVRLGSAAMPTPTTTPATPTPTPAVFPGPTGRTPLPGTTPSAPAGRASPTASSPPSPTASPPTAPTVTGTASAVSTPTPRVQLVVSSAQDPGTVGDTELTLSEAIRLATGKLAVHELSLAEQQHLSGLPGPDSSDVIRFDPLVFPPDNPRTITIQPPEGLSPPVGARSLATPQPGLPPLSTGRDVIDATGAGVVLSAGLGMDLFDGIVITSDGNVVQGLTLSNFNVAVLVQGAARGNLIGGPGPEQGLVLTNNIAGVVLRGNQVTGNRILGNRIGVTASGHGSDGNATHGVLITDGAHANFVGQPGAGNVIGANFLDGIAVLGRDTDDNVIQGNTIGADAAGAAPLANGLGIVVGSGASRTLIGGTAAGSGNLISGNVAEGVWVQSSGTVGTIIQGNIVGAAADRRTALSNGGAGVLISDGARATLIGGSSPQAGNRIAFNGDAGVHVRGRLTVQTTIRRNSITANGGQGILLSDGANAGVASPILGQVTATLVDGVAPPLSTVEIFSDVGDEGGTYEGQVRADANGYFRLEAVAPFSGPNLTATATDGDGNTSAFGRQGQPPPTPTIGPSPTQPPPPTALPRGRRLFLPAAYRNHVLFARVLLDPARQTIPMGAMTWLELKAEAVKGLYGMGVMISFPSQRLEVIDADPSLVGVQIEPGNFPDPSQAFVVENSVDNARGIILYSFTLVDSTPLSGTGVVARLRVRGRGPGEARLEFADYQLSDSRAESVHARARGALVRVLAPPSATPAPTSTSTSTSTPTFTSTTTPSPTNTLPPTFTPSYTPTRPTTLTPSATATPSATVTPRGATATVGPATGTAPASPTPRSTPTPSRTRRPTATLTVTATAPSPTATTPTPDSCTRPLVGGGFETAQGWVYAGGRPPRRVTAPVHHGDYSLLLGILPGEANGFAYSSAWQKVEVPATARTISVAAWTYQAAEPGGGPDRQLMLVYDIDPALNQQGQRSPIGYVFGERVDVRQWQRRTLTMDIAPWRGQSLWLYATVLNDGLGGRVWMNLDDVEVTFCP